MCCLDPAAFSTPHADGSGTQAARLANWGNMAEPRGEGAVARDRLGEMQCAFQPTGGIVTGDAFSTLLRHQSDQPISLLARWIVNRDIVSFEAHAQTWVPIFQFDPQALGVREGVRQVIGELKDVFDDCELAEWFATPNDYLDGVSPANAISVDKQAVLHAARADRFIAVG